MKKTILERLCRYQRCVELANPGFAKVRLKTIFLCEDAPPFHEFYQDSVCLGVHRNGNIRFAGFSASSTKPYSTNFHLPYTGVCVLYIIKTWILAARPLPAPQSVGLNEILDDATIESSCRELEIERYD
jgi:hypothetical protein